MVRKVTDKRMTTYRRSVVRLYIFCIVRVHQSDRGTIKEGKIGSNSHAFRIFLDSAVGRR